MRIIGGTLRGRRLTTVRGPVRPTSDRLRESLFNVLGATVANSCWLDLFAGTGAVGIEAWSRGARRVILVEKEPEVLRLLTRNLELCGIAQLVEVRPRDAITFLVDPKLTDPADFVYLDPPYAFPRYGKLLRKLLDSEAFAPGGLALLELFRKTGLEPLPQGLSLERTLEAGDSRVLFLRRS